MLKRLIWLSMEYPRAVISLVLLVTVAFGIQFPKIHIDTDPENMLPAEQADRVLYNRAKQDFGIHDLIVLGITDEAGIFRPDTLGRVARVVERIKAIHGVIVADLISLTTTDDVRSEGGLLRVRPVTERVPENETGIEALRAAIADNPLFTDKLASEDGTGLAVYIPIERKDQAARIGGELRAILAEELAPEQRYHLAGLPIAEDSFGIEMFRQIAEDTTLGVQGYAEWMHDYDAYRSTLPAGYPQRDRLRTVATLRFTRFQLHQTLRLDLFAFWGVSEGDGYIIPSVRYAFSDALWGELGANLLVGDRKGQFGALGDNDNIYATLRYAF
jgi:hypothetical protein